MNLIKYCFVLIGLLSLLLLSQCRKSDRNNEALNPAPKENAIANVIFNDVFRLIHSLSFENAIVNAPQDANQTNAVDQCVDGVSYASITEQFPNTMAVNFGNDQTKCTLDQRIRNGNLRIVFSKKYSDSLCVMNVEFIDYQVDSVKINANMSITNRGRNSNGEPMFKILVTDAKVEKDTLDFSWSSTRIYTWAKGSESESISDDVFEVSGDSEGITSKGNSYSSEITEKLIADFSCKWIVSGVEKLVPKNLTARTVNYGTSCSSSVSVNYYNSEYEFTLN